DVAGLFECTHAVPAGRGRQVHRLGQLLIADASIAAECAQDIPVDLVEYALLHLPALLSISIQIDNSSTFYSIDRRTIQTICKLSLHTQEYFLCAAVKFRLAISAGTAAGSTPQNCRRTCIAAF